MKAFFGKTVVVTKGLLTRMTASDNYNADVLVAPLQALANSSLETENLHGIVEKARKAMALSRDAFKSESFQFKARLIQDLLDTGFLTCIGGLSREREFTGAMEELLGLCGEVVQAYPEELLFVKLCNVAVQFIPSPAVLRVVGSLLDPPGILRRTQINPGLLSYVVSYGQVSAEARRLIFNKHVLFDGREVVGSVLAALKNQPAQIQLQSHSTDSVVAEVSDLLFLLGRFGGCEGHRPQIVQYTLDQALTLINKECFQNVFQRLGSAPARLPEDQGPAYSGEMLYFCGCLLHVFRKADLLLFREALRSLLFQERSLFHLGERPWEITRIRNLLQEELRPSLAQQVLFGVLGQRYSPEQQLAVNGVLNVVLQILGGSHLLSEEVRKRVGVEAAEADRETEFDRTRAGEAVTNLFALRDTQMKLNGDLLAQSAALNRLAQISAGIARRNLLYEVPGEVLKAYGGEDDGDRREIPGALSYEPLYKLTLRKISEVLKTVLFNDFCGDDGAEVILDRSGKVQETFSYVYSKEQILQLSDFYALTRKVLGQLVLENPLLYGTDEDVAEALKLVQESTQKLGRFVAFLRANHSIFTANASENTWLSVFPGLLENSAALPQELEAIAVGFQVARLKGVPL